VISAQKRVGIKELSAILPRQPCWSEFRCQMQKFF